jgi:hypothetical protein
MPKTDLHNHGWAGADPAAVGEILGRWVAPLDRKLASMDEMHAWAGDHFGTIDPKLRPLLFEAAFVRSAEDGVVRFELGDDVWLITLDGSAQSERLARVSELVPGRCLDQIRENGLSD